MKNQVISELLCVLEIDKDISNVSIRDINVAFRKLALVVHPDKAEDEDKAEKTQELRNSFIIFLENQKW
jgi:DnaJ-class molecular chaperone